jgi:AraC family transcriptional regulator of adaptative response/methylated-DNA-[protein]-cysteine methyltransferase
MTVQQEINYDRIAEAIHYITDNFRDQPDLDAVARQIHLSPFHFQRLFTEWAGVTPKKFLQFISVEHAKKILKEKRTTLFDAAMETGLSGTGRLHDLFVSLEGMTPGEYRNGGENLDINYSFVESPFGNVIIATTSKGICFMSFASDDREGFRQLQQSFPNARFRQMTDMIQQNALYIFRHDRDKLHEIKLHVKGSSFQLKVWETLLSIPFGQLDTYGAVARKMDRPEASRAVGTAIGQNPVAFLIPCHRVIRSTGVIGQYHWGAVRKTAMIGWEAARESA